MIDKITEILKSYEEPVKVGSDGDYEQFNAIGSDYFKEVSRELVEKLNLHNVSNLLPDSFDKDDIEQIEMILDMKEKKVSEAHKQQYIKKLYDWYKEANRNAC